MKTLWMFFVFVFGLFFIQLIAQPSPPQPVLQGLDPVALCQGRNEVGREEFSVVREPYHYRFASAITRDLFLKDPERYQIQMGGGCGRMGSLSGLGDPDRFWVHDGRIYIFASEGCRNAFKANPQIHLEGPDDPPPATPEKSREAQRLLELALQGVGGGKVIDTAQGFLSEMELVYTQKGQVVRYSWYEAGDFSGHYRSEYDWGQGPDGHLLAGGKAVSFQRGNFWRREQPVSEALLRQMARHPLVLLRARARPGFIAVAGDSLTRGGEYFTPFTCIGKVPRRLGCWMQRPVISWKLVSVIDAAPMLKLPFFSLTSALLPKDWCGHMPGVSVSMVRCVLDPWLSSKRSGSILSCRGTLSMGHIPWRIDPHSRSLQCSRLRAQSSRKTLAVQV